MYRRCLFCRADLGTNQVIEPFPVGRRLAFDAAKGRLWEDAEQIALEGELSWLKEAWREAEEIAAIADELTLPERVRIRFEELRARHGRPPAD